MRSARPKPGARVASHHRRVRSVQLDLSVVHGEQESVAFEWELVDAGRLQEEERRAYHVFA